MIDTSTIVEVIEQRSHVTKKPSDWRAEMRWVSNEN